MLSDGANAHGIAVKSRRITTRPEGHPPKPEANKPKSNSSRSTKAEEDNVLLPRFIMLIPIIRSHSTSTAAIRSTVPEIFVNGCEGSNKSALRPLGAANGKSHQAESKETMMILIPDIDLSKLRIIAGVSRTVAAGQIERMRLIFGILIRFYASYRKDKEYCHLNAKKLGKLINTRNVRPLLNALRAAGFIHCDSQYIVQKKSRGFRLTKATLRHGLKFVELSPSLSRRVTMYAPGHHDLDLPPDRLEHQLIWNSLHELTVVDQTWDLLLDGKFRLSASDLQRAWCLRVIEAGQPRIAVSGKTGRLFSTFTSLASDMRQFLRIRGQHCAEVDVGACQPLLLSTLYPVESAEKKHYLDLVTSDQFYETMRADCLQNFKTRASFKTSFMVEVLFGNREHRGTVWKAFSHRFPQLARLRKNFGSNRELALHLQKMEASIVIEKIIPRLFTELNGRPALTLHDAIFCIEMDAGIVKAVMKEEFEQVIGITPVVKIKYLRNGSP